MQCLRLRLLRPDLHIRHFLCILGARKLPYRRQPGRPRADNQSHAKDEQEPMRTPRPQGDTTACTAAMVASMIQMTPPSYGAHNHLPSIGRCFLGRVDEYHLGQTGRGCIRCTGVLQGTCRCTTGSQGQLLLAHFPWPPSRSSRSKASFLVDRGAMHPRCKPITYRASLPFARRLRAPARGSGDHVDR